MGDVGIHVRKETKESDQDRLKDAEELPAPKVQSRKLEEGGVSFHTENTCQLRSYVLALDASFIHLGVLKNLISGSGLVENGNHENGQTSKEDIVDRHGPAVEERLLV